MTVSEAPVSLGLNISDGEQFLYRFEHQALSPPSKGLWQNLNQTFDWVSEYTLTVNIGMSGSVPYIYSLVMLDFRFPNHTAIASRIVTMSQVTPGVFTPFELTLDTRTFEGVVGEDIIVGIRFVAGSVSLAIDDISVCVNR